MIVVCTAHDAPYKTLADVTLPNLKAYCRRHGYALAYDDDIPGDEKDLCKGRIFRYLFQSGRYSHDDLFMWIDTDAIIANLDERVEDVWARCADPETHFLWSYNWDGPNSGVWIARFSAEAENFVRVYSFEQVAMGWGDQNAMNQKSLYAPFKYWVKCVPGRVMNASPWDEYGMGHLPHKDAVNNYNPGDWIVHLPGMEASRRIEILRTFSVAPAPAPAPMTMQKYKIAVPAGMTVNDVLDAH